MADTKEEKPEIPTHIEGFQTSFWTRTPEWVLKASGHSDEQLKRINSLLKNFSTEEDGRKVTLGIGKLAPNPWPVPKPEEAKVQVDEAVKAEESEFDANPTPDTNPLSTQ